MIEAGRAAPRLVVGEAGQYAKGSNESILIQRDIENASFGHQAAPRTGYTLPPCISI